MRAKTYGYFDVGEHAWMLLDKARISAFANAIKAVVKPGDVVADIGAGSGILALIAAKAGASKVYAVEQGNMSFLARKIIDINGFSNIIEVIKDNARNIDFPLKPDVLVSEMIGSFGFDEDILDLLQTVASRCKKDVKIIPAGFDIYAAPIYDHGLENEFNYLNSIENFDFSPLVDKLKSRPVHHKIKPEEVVGKPVLMQKFEVKTSEVPQKLSGKTKITESGKVNSVGIWVEMHFENSESLSTGPYSEPTHWYNIKFPFPETFETEKDSGIEFNLYPFLLGRNNWKWEVKYKNNVFITDSWHSFVGSKNDMLLSFGLKRKAPQIQQDPVNLKKIARSLDIKEDYFDLKTMALQLYKNLPGYYNSEEDALRDLTALLNSIHALE